MTLPLDGLDLLNAPAILTAGAPLQLPLDLIDEDPDQPRQDFDKVTLAELTDSVKARGVLQAISVRRHPVTPDRWMVNSVPVGCVRRAWQASPRSRPMSTTRWTATTR